MTRDHVVLADGTELRPFDADDLAAAVGLKPSDRLIEALRRGLSGTPDVDPDRLVSGMTLADAEAVLDDVSGYPVGAVYAGGALEVVQRAIRVRQSKAATIGGHRGPRGRLLR